MVGAGTDDGSLYLVHHPQLGDHTSELSILHLNIHNLPLLQGKVGLVLNHPLHIMMVSPAVGLHSQTVYRRPLPQIQHPALQKGGVGSFSHLAAQGVDFSHQVPLGSAADGRVAGHIGQAVQTQGEQYRFHPQPCCCQSRFDSCMAGADYRNLKLFANLIHGNFLYFPTQKFRNTSSTTASEAFSPVSSSRAETPSVRSTVTASKVYPAWKAAMA